MIQNSIFTDMSAEGGIRMLSKITMMRGVAASIFLGYRIMLLRR